MRNVFKLADNSQIFVKDIETADVKVGLNVIIRCCNAEILSALIHHILAVADSGNASTAFVGNVVIRKGERMDGR